MEGVGEGKVHLAGVRDFFFFVCEITDLPGMAGGREG